MKTIKQLHDQWAASVMPSGASQVQRQEMERAFFSGALSLYRLQIDDIMELSDNEAEKALSKVRVELADYFRLLGTIPGPYGAQRQ